MGNSRADVMRIRCSFIVPVYNNAEYLELCISSIYNCCKNIDSNTEIIIIDDGSSNTCSAIVDKYLQSLFYIGHNNPKCDSIRWIIAHTVNKGVSSARNIGLRIASGEYVLFIDSDDTIDSQRMLECIHIISSDNNIDMVIYGMSFDYYRRGTCYRRSEAIPPFKGIKDIEGCKNNIDILFDTNSLSSLCNKIIKREVINSIYLCEWLTVCEDLEFSLRAMANCEELYFYDKPVYHYRQSESEGNSVNRLKRVKSVRCIVDQVEAALLHVTDHGEHILTSIYSYLVIDKIKGTKRSHVKDVCDEYRLWIDSKGYTSRNELVYTGDVNRICFQLALSKMRHQVANAVKTLRYRFRNLFDKSNQC